MDGVVLALFALISLGIHDAPAEIDWRDDYYAARQEARDKNLPLVLYVCPKNNFHCACQNSLIAKDAELKKLLNEKTIPLKIDSERFPRLAEVLGIRMFPTFILAGPDGKIVNHVLGTHESANLREKIEKLVSATATANQAKIRWHTDHAAARKLAKEKNRPLVLFFGSETSFYGIKQERALELDRDMIDLLNDHVIPVRFVYEKDEQPFLDHGVERFPTFRFFNADGKPFGEPIVGFHETADLRTEIKKLIDKNKSPTKKEAASPQIEWRDDYTAACKEAAEKKRMVVLFAHAPPSIFCVRMEQQMQGDAELVGMFNERVIPVKIDVTTVRGDAFPQLNLRTSPTLEFLGPDGKRLREPIIGYRDAAGVRGDLQKVIEMNAPR